MTLREKIGWGALALLAACALAVVAFERGEHVNALWIVTAAVSVQLIAYRFYARYIARHVMQLDPSRPTPALRHGMAKAGDRVIVLAGVPFRTPGSTNVLHVVRIVGDELKGHHSQV